VSDAQDLPSGLRNEAEASRAGLLERTRAWWSRNLWLCPLLAIVLATAVLHFVGLSPWTAIVIAAVAVCPAVLVWGVVITRKRRRMAAPERPASREAAQGNRHGR
jgi:Flp pilus assembly protein TadB